MNHHQQQERGDSATANGAMESGVSSPPFASQTRPLFSLPQYFADDGTFPNLYSSIFPSAVNSPQTLASSSSLPLTPSSLSCDDDDSHMTTTDHRLYLARLTLQYREMEERYDNCLSHLHDADQEAEALREENARLRRANTDLERRLNPIPGKQQQHQRNVLLPAATNYLHNSMSFADGFRRLSVGGDDLRVETSPTSVLGFGELPFRQQHQQQQQRKPQRISLPKSISIRSSGYLKIAGSGRSSNRENHLRIPSPVIMGSQRLFVPAGPQVSAQEEAQEFEVYNQGMFKTELCNKWEETGACPYGDHCQFAHGVGELRPVIRHPRYKTDICRMVLAGGTCPYGHRCHFRHALIPQEQSFLGPAAGAP